ncbi:hypothetical protein MLP_45960 [Microlunatus phosphovorus NM-1]|uniref:Putative regulatory protein FmdB zinc ribbon domain-containing protein n=1 Tax=Microlunatus phosphovorus (strain ATCC 700054 / DSM 10555 / JCM 9379 / NBRC 101784 / NCIMB 13414 / VKM Ac-1990 / NM-1) TaxID=1032480 RepID=F5XE62_MICPN|nr:FmdB family zinc ribbon protein [Microlunatus phosphovorus]BAK37610.1 hypothetical protein MLP_45960 [Microlunatus phosphovorus NM-1]
MPTYQYRCSDCGNELEAVQKFTDAALTDCPTCDGSLRKVFNAVGVVFKGSGFYRTDSRADQKKKSGSGASKSDSSKSDSGEKKTSTTEKKSEGSGSRQPVAAGSSSGSGSSGESSSTAA